MKHISHN